MSRYAKALVAAVGAAITAALGIIPSDSAWGKALTIAAAALTTIGVYLTPNLPAAGEPADPNESVVGPGN